MHFNTFCVLFFGCLLFTMGCWGVHIIVAPKLKKKAKRRLIGAKETITRIDVSIWKIIIIIAVQALSLYIVSRDMRAVVGRYGISGDFALIMYRFREYHLFSDKDVALSSLSSNIRLFSIAVSYVWIYIVCNNFIGKFRNKKMIPMLFSIVLGVVNCVVLGSRGEAIQLIVAAFVIFVFLQKKYNGWKSNIKFRQIVIVGIIIFGVMYGFKASGDLLGRSSVSNYHTSAVDELAKYLGAEIKNLDTYLENPFNSIPDAIPGGQTFGFSLGWLSNLFGINWKISSELPFQRVNGISLGNVYTVFYAYIYDFGYIGLVVLTLLMSFFCQLIYEHLIVERKKTKINFRIIVNSYVLFLVAFSFFGERFFTYVINISMIKYLLIWKLMIEFCVGKKFRLSNRMRSTTLPGTRTI